jgi:hypothetical protein
MDGTLYCRKILQKNAMAGLSETVITHAKKIQKSTAVIVAMLPSDSGNCTCQIQQ